MRRAFFRKAVLPFMDLCNGSSVKEKLKFLEESQYWSEQRLTEYRNARLQGVINYAYEEVPYYRQLFDRSGFNPRTVKSEEDLNAIPPLTKTLVKENFERLQARSFNGSFYRTYTSGSTGQPTPFIVTKENQSWEYASAVRVYETGGYQMGDGWLRLVLNPTVVRGDSPPLRTRVLNLLTNCVYCFGTSFNEKDLSGIHGVMRRRRIEYIMGYPSSLFLLAKYLQTKGWRLPLKAVFTSGEILSPSVRALLKRVFDDCHVIDHYGLGGEQTTIAFQCEKEGPYHLNMEHCFAEVEANGQVLVTTLDNFRMPLIRYDTGDVAETEPAKCSCQRGLRCVRSISGRNTDIVIAPNGSRLIVHFFTELFEFIMGVDKFQVVQEAEDRLVVRMVVNRQYSPSDERRILDRIGRETGNSLNVAVEYVQQIPDAPSGKRRFVVSTVSDDFK